MGRFKKVRTDGKIYDGKGEARRGIIDRIKHEGLTDKLVRAFMLPCVSILITIVFFFLFYGDANPGILFYFNMCYTCILEVIFFGYLRFMRVESSKMSGAIYSIMGVYSLYYIIVAVFIMLSYSLLLFAFIPFKFYIAVVIVITLLWVILGALLVETDATFKESVEKLQAQGRTLGYFLKRMEIHERRYMDISREQSIPDESKSYLCELSRLSIKIKSLMPDIFTNELAQIKLQDILDNCTELLNEIEQGGDVDKKRVASRVKRFVDNSIDEIELLKSLVRR